MKKTRKLLWKDSLIIWAVLSLIIFPMVWRLYEDLEPGMEKGLYMIGHEICWLIVVVLISRKVYDNGLIFFDNAQRLDDYPLPAFIFYIPGLLAIYFYVKSLLVSPDELGLTLILAMIYLGYVKNILIIGDNYLITGYSAWRVDHIRSYHIDTRVIQKKIKVKMADGQTLQLDYNPKVEGIIDQYGRKREA